MASNESENFYRVVSLLVDVGTEVLRKMFMKYVLSSANPSGLASSSMSPELVYLVNHQSVLMQLHKKKILRKDQLSLLMPSQGRGVDPALWDISLFSILLKNICPITPSELTDIDSLRQARNTVYGHTSSATMKLADYTTNWQAIDSILKSLLQSCNDTIFESEMLTCIKKVETGPLDIGATVNILKQWFTLDREIEDKLGDIDEKVNALVSNISDIKDAQSTRVNPAFIKMIKHTEAILEESKQAPFISTKQFENANHIFNSENVVLLSGGPGDGKTSAAQKLLTLNHPLDKCVIMHAPHQWDNVELTQVEAILIDDVFGRSGFEEKRLKDWIPVLDMIESCIKTKEIKIIFVSRESVYEHCRLFLTRYDIFKHKIEIKSSLLSLDEKVAILKSFLSNYGISMSTETAEMCCKQYKFRFGFPLASQFFTSKPNVLIRGDLFFSTPCEVFEYACNTMSKMEYLTLLFMFYKRNSIADVDLKPKRRPRLTKEDDTTALLREITEFVDMNPYIVNIKLMGDNLTLLTNIFEHKNQSYSFADISIYDCVALHFGKKFPEEVIQFCTVEFLCERITFTPDSSPEDKLNIDKGSFPILANRVITEITEGNKRNEMMTFSIFSNKHFCKVLYETLTIEGKAKEFLESPGEDETEFTTQLLDANSDIFCDSFATILADNLRYEELGDTNTTDDHFTGTEITDCSYWKCVVAKHTLDIICLKGYEKCFKAFLKLYMKENCMNEIHVKRTQFLARAVKGRNTFIIESLVEYITDTDSDEMEKALKEANTIGNGDIIEILNKKTCSFADQ